MSSKKRRFYKLGNREFDLDDVVCITDVDNCVFTVFFKHIIDGDIITGTKWKHLQQTYDTEQIAKEEHQKLIDAWHYPQYQDVNYALDLKKKLDNIDKMILAQGWVPIKQWMKSDEYRVECGKAEILQWQYEYDTIHTSRYLSGWYYDESSDWDSGAVNWGNVNWVRMIEPKGK